MKSKIIPEEIKEYLLYNEFTGLVVWIKTPSRNVKIGDVVANPNKGGYYRVGFKGNKYLLHRVIWFLKTGKQPPALIDHKDTIRTNNIWLNLREATHSENNYNSKKPINNVSGFKGVHFDTHTCKWAACVSVKNSTKHLGKFNTPEAAHAAYCNYCDIHHNEFANYG